MKKSMGNDSQKPTREARNPQRASRAASSGMGVPCSALARVQAISFFCTRHTTPHAFSSIRKPNPPPTLIDRCAFETSAPLFKSRMIHEASITMGAIEIARTQELLSSPLLGNCNGYIRAYATSQTTTHHPNQRNASAGLPEFCASAERIVK